MRIGRLTQDPAPSAAPVTAQSVAGALDLARARSLTYTDIDAEELVRQHSPLMSPLVWDLAHIGNYEDLWLVRALGDAAATRPGLDDVYDAFRHSRASRIRLALLDPAEARAYLHEVRGRTLDALDRLAPLPTGPGEADAPPLPGTGGPGEPARPGDPAADRRRLLAGGFVYGMVIQHEHQHDETMLATHQLRAGPPLLAPGQAPPPGRTVPRAEVLVPAGPCTLGTSTEPWAYDNERPAHRVDLPAFWIDTLPVSNRAHIAFIDAGGYDDERLWSPAGWQWRRQENLTAPAFWWRDGEVWLRRRFGRVEPVPLDEPVQHVCWYEAEAHARWAGRRLPTEAEWEKAAAHDPATGRSRRYPWGDTDPTPEHANLGHRTSGPAPLGAFPAGASPCGAEQMIGDVWEWTASGFTPYPGFRSHPYREYSEVFFPKPGADSAFRVLRGGSWATDPAAVRTTFRNWDYPIRRQIFAGFRLARDAG
ncbi:ergothioneine biosynthesis protein EgtB [Frankia torreyi]|uniref:Hercynine oxygenase n=1 Tax=Frankia torreyi TaxID=1856 RepID=A0A0D8BGT2_9ACTN|nr:MULTISPECIES: ergothioneine biosynthesis protein EgtB [Frankia]KJE22652.1 ergothioneine biosynthesis protein EgtB [Frankia torreyi]KQC40181.1 sulfatase-modifying factor 1 [Frankia sp. ACN1ag]